MENSIQKSIDNLAYYVEDLKYAVEGLTEALNRTDDFNNWSYAESLASIANSLVKHNALVKKDQEKDW